MPGNGNNGIRPIQAMSIPNILTISRILMTPLLVILLTLEEFTLALIVFGVAGITDGLDGLIARWFDQRTRLGAVLDPIADKMLLITLFLTLAVRGIVPEWISIVVLSRDVLILAGLALLIAFHVPYEIKPRVSSKMTTAAQILTVFLVLADRAVTPLGSLLTWFYWITAAFTMVSGFQYLYIGMNLLHDLDSEQEGGPPDRR